MAGGTRRSPHCVSSASTRHLYPNGTFRFVLMPGGYTPNSAANPVVTQFRWAPRAPLGPILAMFSTFWAHIGAILGPFWIYLGPHHGPMMGPWLDPYWAHVGPMFGPKFAPILGPSWDPIWAHGGPSYDLVGGSRPLLFFCIPRKRKQPETLLKTKT
jgi:hypothetical protein